MRNADSRTPCPELIGMMHEDRVPLGKRLSPRHTCDECVDYALIQLAYFAPGSHSPTGITADNFYGEREKRIIYLVHAMYHSHSLYAPQGHNLSARFEYLAGKMAVGIKPTRGRRRLAYK